MDQLFGIADGLAFLFGLVGPSLFAFGFMTLLEMILPRGERQSLAGRIPGLLFWMVLVPFGALIHHVYHVLWAGLGIPPLITLPLGLQWTGALAAFLAPILGAVAYDFFFYWCHRAQHRWFWRFHAVHHSIEDLSAVNSFHHISEPFFQTALILLPISLIGWDTSVAALIVIMLIYLQASLIHSPTAFHFGPLRVFVDNRFHRIHHSLQQEHFDKNFGAFTTIWDRLFGTAWMPAPDEWPDTGLAEMRQPRTARAWLSLPWRYGRDNEPEAARGGPFSEPV